MKKFNLSIFVLLVLNHCSTSSNTEIKTKSIIQEYEQIPRELIGTPLKTVQEKEKELNFKFKFLILESFHFDIDSDGKEDEIIIEKIKNWNDPGDFHRIRIKSQEEEYAFFNSDGWITIGEYETQYLNSFSENSMVKSKYVNMQKSSDEDILLFAFGYVYANQPGLLSILNLSRFDQPELILNDNFYLYGYEDKNGDGTFDIVVTKYDKDEMGNKNDVKAYLLLNGCYQSK